MPAKVLSGDGAIPASKIEWRQVSASPGPAPHRDDSPAREGGDAMRARVAELEAQFSQRLAQERESAYREGQAAGRAEAAARFDAAVAKLEKTLVELAGLRRKIRAEAEHDLVKLSLAIARKILHRELQVDRDALLGIVKAALGRVSSAEVHRVRMNPEDAAGFERRRPVQLEGVEIVADASIGRGGVIFETRRGNLDASVETQLAEIERGFTDLLEKK